MRSLTLPTLALAVSALLACSGGSGTQDGSADLPGPTPDGGADSFVPGDGPAKDHTLFNDSVISKDSTTPSDGPVGQPATIQQITSDQIAEGTVVSLASVTVTAVDTGGQYTGDIYVQDGTGAGSGLRIYTPTRGDGGQITDLKVGDSVKVVGQVKNWAPSAGFPGGKTVKELVNGTVTLNSSGTPPSPTIVTATQLTTEPGAAGWEHVLVQVKDVKVTGAVNSYGEFKVSGGLTVDDELYAHTPAVGDCLTITGIAAYFYNYRLMPRAALDIQPSTSCAGPTTLTIQDIQDVTSANHPAENTQVTVSGVVTAVDSTKNSYGDYEGFFIQDPAGGQYSGIYVYHKWTDASAQKPVVGEVIEITGTYQEYGNVSGTVSELSSVSWNVTGSAALPAPATVAAADMAAGGTVAEAHEGVLIQVNNIQVGSYFTDSGGVAIGFSDSATGFLVIHKLFDFMNPPPPINTTYAKVVGPLHFAVGTFEVMPRSAADMVP